MQRLKRWLIRILPGLVLGLLIASPVFAYTYYAQIQVRETEGNSYNKLGMLAEVDNQYLVDNGYITSTGLDTRVEVGGAAIPHIITDSEVFFAYDIGANSTSNFNYTLGNTPLTSFYVVPGYNGTVTIPDDDTLELQGQFEVEYEGYIDFSSNGKIVSKPDAFAISVTDTDEVSAGLVDYEDWTGTQNTIYTAITPFEYEVDVLTSNTIVIVYEQSTTIYGRVGTISGDSVSWGAAQTLSTNDPTGLRMCAINDDTIAVAYRNVDGNNDGYSLVAEVSGDTITTTDTDEFENVDVYDVTMCKAADDKYAIFYEDDAANTCTVVINSFNGSTITSGTPLDFEAYAPRGPMPCAYLSDDKVGVVTDTGNPDYNYEARAITISGTTPTANTPVEIWDTTAWGESNDQYGIEIATDKMGYTLVDTSGGDNGIYAGVVEFNGTTPSGSDPVMVVDQYNTAEGLAAVNEQYLVVTFTHDREAGSGDEGCSMVLPIDGTSLATSSIQYYDGLFDSSDDVQEGAIVHDPGSTLGMIVCYEEYETDDMFSKYGTIGDIVWDEVVQETSLTSGEYKVKITADGTNIKLYVDDIEEDSTAQSGASVPDNDYDWIIGGSQAPYWESYKSSTLGTTNPYSTGSGTTGSTTDHVITMPSSISAGDRLVVIFSADGARTCSDGSATWTELSDLNDGTYITGAVYYKTATGSDTLTITTNGACYASHISIAIPDPDGSPTDSDTTGNSQTPDPPSHDAGSSDDYVWIAAMCKDGGQEASAAPSGYETSFTVQDSSYATSAIGVKQYTGQTDNPGTFSTGGTDQWVTFTIAVPVSTFGAISQQVYFEPNAMIDTTTDELPDRSSGGTNDGTINWGAMPSGVTATFGSLVSANAPTPQAVSGDTGTSPDIVGPIEPPTRYVTTDITILDDNPFAPLVNVLATHTGFTATQIWIGLASVAVAVVGVVCLKFLKNQLINAIIIGVMLAFIWQLGIYPFWIPLIYGIIATSIVVWERVHAV